MKKFDETILVLDRKGNVNTFRGLLERESVGQGTFACYLAAAPSFVSPRKHRGRHPRGVSPRTWPSTDKSEFRPIA